MTSPVRRRRRHAALIAFDAAVVALLVGTAAFAFLPSVVR